MSKGEILISMVAGEALIDPNTLMSNKKFVSYAKKLIKDKMDFIVIKDKLVKWCNNNY
jgi:hypothetical protein